MRKQCAFGGCRKIAVTDTSRCEDHKLTYTPKKKLDHHYHQGKNIYSSARWVKLRKQFITHNPLCAHHEAMGIFVPGQMVDHIKEIKDGGEIWDIDNLQTLCHSCHNTKTGDEVKKRSRRNKTNGFGCLSDF